MAENKIEIRITARDDASKVFKNFANSVERYFKEIETASKTAVRSIQQAWSSIDIQNVFTEVGTDAATAADRATTEFRGAATNIEKSFSDMKADGKKAFDKMEDGVKDFGRTAKKEFKKTAGASDKAAKDVKADWKDVTTSANTSFNKMSVEGRAEFNKILAASKKTSTGIASSFKKGAKTAEVAIDKFSKAGIADFKKLETRAKTSAASMKATFKGLQASLRVSGSAAAAGAGAAGAGAAGVAGAAGLGAGGVAGGGSSINLLTGQLQTNIELLKLNKQGLKDYRRDLDRGVMSQREYARRVARTNTRMTELKGKIREASKAQERLNKTTKTGIPNWAKWTAGIYLGIRALRLLVRGISGAIEAANKQAAAIIQTETVMRSMGVYSAEYSERLQQIARDLQGVTNYGDEVTLSGAKMLLTFKDIGEVTPGVMETMLDLAALMEGDVKQAALTLGKAAMGQIGALTRLGITVDRATYEMYGFEGVLKAIQSQVAGQARAVREATGPFKAFKNTWGDLVEVMGEALKQDLAVFFDRGAKYIKRYNDNLKETLDLEKRRAETGYFTDLAADIPERVPFFGGREDQLFIAPKKEFIDFMNEMEAGWGYTAEEMVQITEAMGQTAAFTLIKQYAAAFTDIEKLHKEMWGQIKGLADTEISAYRSGVKELYETFGVGAKAAAMVDVAQLRERLLKFKKLGLDQKNLSKAAYEGMGKIIKDYADKGEMSVLNMLGSIRSATHKWFDEMGKPSESEFKELKSKFNALHKTFDKKLSVKLDIRDALDKMQQLSEAYTKRYAETGEVLKYAADPAYSIEKAGKFKYLDTVIKQMITDLNDTVIKESQQLETTALKRGENFGQHFMTGVGNTLTPMWHEFMKPISEEHELKINATVANREIGAAITSLLKLRKEIDKALLLDIKSSEAIEALNRVKTEYLRIKTFIENNPPTVKVKVEASGSPTLPFSQYMRYMADKLNEMNTTLGATVSFSGMGQYIEALRGVRSDMAFFSEWAKLIVSSPGSNLGLAGFHSQVAEMASQLESVVLLAQQAGMDGIDNAVGGMRSLFSDMRRALEVYGLGQEQGLLDFQRLRDMFNTGLIDMLKVVDAAVAGGTTGGVNGTTGGTTTTTTGMEVNIIFGGITINAEIQGRSVEYDSEELAAMIDQKIGEEIIYDRSRIRDALEEVFQTP